MEGGEDAKKNEKQTSKKSREKVIFFCKKDCFFDLKYCRSPSKFSSVAPRARKGQVVNKLLMDCA